MRNVKSAELPPLTPDSEVRIVDGKGFAVEALRKGCVSLHEVISNVVAPDSNLFAAGTSYPTMADFCIVPHLYNCRRFGIDLTPFPSLVAIDERCRSVPAFARAAPEVQPDAAP